METPAIDKTTLDFEKANLKVKKIRRFIEREIYNADIAQYIPGTLDLVFHGMIVEWMNVLDFELKLDNNFYTNLKSLHICFPVRF